MKYAKKKKNTILPRLLGAVMILFLLGCFVLLLGLGEEKGPKEVEKTVLGLDAAKYQGTIDWAQAAGSGVEFAMIRVGYRTQVDGTLVEDSNARYNLQEGARQGIPLGAYFFSTAVSKEEAREEAAWVAELLAPYPITYPVAYNCEGFQDPENRQHSLTVAERTDIALAFLEAMEEQGYEAMFYASKNEMEGDILWETSRIETSYKIWVAQYPEEPYPQTQASTYSGSHQMWQYTRTGTVPGVPQSVDLDVAYFAYDGIRSPKSKDPAPEAKPDPEALMVFREVEETVTAKEEVNLRSIPSQDTDSEILTQLFNGDTAVRTGISDSGWSRILYQGQVYYAVSGYLTTDLSYTPGTEGEAGEMDSWFEEVNETVTAKELVNLRSFPSTNAGESEVVCQLSHGEEAIRVGISRNGWSKLIYQEQILYAVSSYLEVISDKEETQAGPDEVIDTIFTDVDDQVTAKELVNLRSIPSVTASNSQIVAQLKQGEVIRRTGINADQGWSRVEYNGQILYCVTRLLEIVE